MISWLVSAAKLMPCVLGDGEQSAPGLARFCFTHASFADRDLLVPRTDSLIQPQTLRVFGGTFATRFACGLALAAVIGCGQKDAQPGAAAPTGAAATESPGGASPSDARNAERVGRASIFVVHMMSDYDAFKKYFEAGAEDRAKAGVKGYLLTRLDDGSVVIHFFADDVATVQNALKAPEMEKFIDRKGAPETSLVWLTRDVDVKLPATPPTGETYSLFLRVKVADFAALERAFRERHAVFAEQGVIAEGLHRSTDTEDLAVLHFMGTARDKLAALPKRKEFVELLTQAKVQGEVKPLVGVDVARNRPK